MGSGVWWTASICAEQYGVDDPSMTARQDSQFDVIVAGVGSVGSAALYQLARSGARVLGLEQSLTIPHEDGSHHGHSRMIRQAYFEHPDYVPLLRRAYDLWDELQSLSGDRFLHLTGGLYIGPEDGVIVPGSLQAAREHELPHMLAPADEFVERYPVLNPCADQLGFFEDRGGFLVPEKAVNAYVHAACHAGADLHAGEALRSWKCHDDHVEVTTDRASYSAEKLIITSGAGSAAAIRDLGIELQVTRQVLAWFKPLGTLERFEPGRFPCWFIETASPYGHYGFPILAGDPGLKIALHKPGEIIDPAGEVEPPRDSEIDALRAILDRYFPGCAGELAHACTCKYTNSPDSHFIVGNHPRHERVSIACGLSGHGFKFSSVLGEVLADLALEGKTALPIEFLSPLRFGN
ncbi:MAG: sarcosine oxidase [Pseudoalteromonas tetraodonis]|jgi:sarcosine oxidase